MEDTKNSNTLPHILVVGSSNTDMVVNAARLPLPGETIMGGRFFMNPGGKGANQAVAAARLGACVTFVCKVGNDIFGQQAIDTFRNEGIDTSSVLTDAELPSGVALITVDAHAENCIVVASGSNANLLPADLSGVEKSVEQSDVVLLQLEIPMETVEYIAGLAKGKGKRLILNPAPAQTLSSSLLKNLYLITPNETEAGLITGIKVVDDTSACLAAKELCRMGVQHVIITRGSKGALVYSDLQMEYVPAVRTIAVDTTAAGDVFNGALAVALGEGKVLLEAVRFANRAAAISVTRPGAQNSIPFRNEL